MKIYKRYCNNCGEYYEGYGQFYCSHKCLGMAQKNKERSEETKRKIGEANRKYCCDENFFSIHTPQSCYWAGFIAADGCIASGSLLHICLSNRDYGHLESFLKFIRSNYPIHMTKCRNKYLLCYIDISSKQIVIDLNFNFNVTPRKTFTIQYPKQMPRKFDKYFIRGYFDGDGCIYSSKSIGKYKDKIYFYKKRKLSWELASSSFDILKDIQIILCNKCNVRKNLISQMSGCSCYRLRCSGNLQVPRIMNFLSMPFALSRKNLKGFIIKKESAIK